MPPKKIPVRILEISIPHATQEGTLKAAMSLPDEIASSGFDVVFVLPWMKVNRQLSRSPYAVTDYTQLNERIGNFEDTRSWITQCKEAGLKVVLDIPLNHTGTGHDWTKRMNWYATDEQGSLRSPAGTTWTDVVQLNHAEPMVSYACEQVLRFWLEFGVDGFRFDAASFIPDSVLQQWIGHLNKWAGKELLLWCDGEQYFRTQACFNGFLYHEAFLAAKHDLLKWEDMVKKSPCEGIFYLSNHDTLHRGISPEKEWGDKYAFMREILESSAANSLFSWSDWKNPKEFYSFML